MSRVLVVDDRESGRRSLTRELEDFGFEVRAAASAHEALESLAVFDPGIIVTDFQMPAIDGLELLRRVRTFSDAPIIVISAYNSPGLRRRCIEMGATSVLDFNEDLALVAPLAWELVRKSAESSHPATRESVRTRKQTIRQAETERVYLECDGNVSEASRRLHKSRGSVRYQLRKLGINV